jgi:PDDEXK-like uncharacterized protein DUF3799
VIIYDLPYGKYRAHPNLGSTDLKNLLKTPAHYRQAKENESTTRAKDMGRAIHSYMLEYSTFFQFHAVEPDGIVHKGRNPWKKDWAKFKADNADKIIVDRETWAAIKGIQKSIAEHPEASSIFERSRTEVSIIGEKRKARADLFSGEFIADLKSCDDATEDKFLSSIQKYGYYLQAAMYLDEAKAADGRHRDFIWVACETKPPYGVQVFMGDDEMIERGRREYLAAQEIYDRCVENNHWPKYDRGIKQLSLRKGFKGALR